MIEGVEAWAGSVAALVEAPGKNDASVLFPPPLVGRLVGRFRHCRQHAQLWQWRPFALHSQVEGPHEARHDA